MSMGLRQKRGVVGVQRWQSDRERGVWLEMLDALVGRIEQGLDLDPETQDEGV